MTDFTAEQRASLITQLRTTLLYTEHSGSTSTIYNFSNAGGNSSTLMGSDTI